MKAILLTPIIVMFFILALSCAAHSMTMQDLIDQSDVETIKAHAVNSEGSYKFAHQSNVRAIDGKQESIVIAGVEKLGYLTMPPSKKTMERYSHER